ncbi:MAG: hypothetical protein WCO60_12875 [Verrucomicrobiota bacterium]
MLIENQSFYSHFLPTPANKIPMPSPEIKVGYNKQRGTWIVNIPAVLSESGERERPSFATKSRAQAHKDAQDARLLNDGSAGATLGRVERDIAAKAFQRLQLDRPEFDPSELLTAVSEYLETRDRRRRSKLFKEGFEEWMNWTFAQTHKGKPISDSYRKQIRQVLPRVPTLHGLLMCEITPEDVEAALRATLRPEHKQMRNGMVRVLNACFGYSKERGWLDNIPIRKDTKADTGQKEPEILTPDQVTRLLSTCLAMDRELLGFYVIALFGGIRPTGELSKLQWNHVFAGGGKRIHVPAEVSKTGRIRYVPIEPTLKAWLEFIQPPHVGPVSPRGRLERRRKKIESAAGIIPWPQDGMRHSYASYWMATHRDEDRCRDNMGHRTKDQLTNHYRQHTTEEEAQAFWGLIPEIVLKISPIGAVVSS